MCLSSLQYENAMAVMEMVKLYNNVLCVELFLAFEIKMSQQNGIKISFYNYTTG